MKTSTEATMSDGLLPILLASHVDKRAPANAPAWMTDTMFDDKFARTASDLSVRPYCLFIVSDRVHV